jgi:hypothetical protein
MAYETKVILSLLAQQIGKSRSVREAYMAVVKAANVEGVELPSYEDYQKELNEYEAQES